MVGPSHLSLLSCHVLGILDGALLLADARLQVVSSLPETPNGGLDLPHLSFGALALDVGLRQLLLEATPPRGGRVDLLLKIEPLLDGRSRTRARLIELNEFLLSALDALLKDSEFVMSCLHQVIRRLNSGPCLRQPRYGLGRRRHRG